MFPGASPQSLPAFCPRASKLVSQNEFEPPIRQRIGEQTSRRGVTFPGTELGTVPEQFASPDTKGPPAHYALSVDRMARIAHCSSPGPFYSENGALASNGFTKGERASAPPFGSPQEVFGRAISVSRGTNPSFLGRHVILGSHEYSESRPPSVRGRVARVGACSAGTPEPLAEKSKCFERGKAPWGSPLR
jgi:hypothetical protein